MSKGKFIAGLMLPVVVAGTASACIALTNKNDSKDTSTKVETTIPGDDSINNSGVSIEEYNFLVDKVNDLESALTDCESSNAEKDAIIAEKDAIIVEKNSTIDYLNSQLSNSPQVVESDYEILNSYVQDVVQGDNKLEDYNQGIVGEEYFIHNDYGYLSGFSNQDFSDEYFNFYTNKKVLTLTVNDLFDLGEDSSTFNFGYCSDESDIYAFESAKFKLTDLSVIPDAIKIVTEIDNLNLSIYPEMFANVNKHIVLDLSDCKLSSLTLTTDYTGNWKNVTIIAPKSSLYEDGISNRVYTAFSRGTDYNFVFDAELYSTFTNFGASIAHYVYELNSNNGLKSFIDLQYTHNDLSIQNSIVDNFIKPVAEDFNGFYLKQSDSYYYLYLDANYKGLTIESFIKMACRYMENVCSSANSDDFIYSFVEKIYKQINGDEYSDNDIIDPNKPLFINFNVYENA